MSNITRSLRFLFAIWLASPKFWRECTKQMTVGGAEPLRPRRQQMWNPTVLTLVWMRVADTLVSGGHASQAMFWLLSGATCRHIIELSRYCYLPVRPLSCRRPTSADTRIMSGQTLTSRRAHVAKHLRSFNFARFRVWLRCLSLATHSLDILQISFAMPTARYERLCLISRMQILRGVN